LELFHVTLQSNIASIFEKGLIPQIGERSERMEHESGIFLFDSYNSVENAMMNWLGEELEDTEEDIVLLAVKLPDDFPLKKEVEWEYVSTQTIPPSCISISTLNL